MNLEVNAQFHGMQRALTEAIDLNSFLEYHPPSTSGEPSESNDFNCQTASHSTTSNAAPSNAASWTSATRMSN
eukprot:COSAG06_NODE_4039_length_4637_cov_1.773468_1_plen_73_part_00